MGDLRIGLAEQYAALAFSGRNTASRTQQIVNA
jgi:hypothetical protein